MNPHIFNAFNVAHTAAENPNNSEDTRRLGREVARQIWLSQGRIDQQMLETAKIMRAEISARMQGALKRAAADCCVNVRCGLDVNHAGQCREEL